MTRAGTKALLPVAALLVAAGPFFALTAARAADQNVGVFSFAYQPADVSVGLNERVTWFNQSAEPHTVTSDGGFFDSGTMAPYGGGYQVAFQRAGTFPYHCALHPQMRGVVRVAGGGPTTPPPTSAPGTPPGTAPGSPPTSARPPLLPPPTFVTTTTTRLGGAATTTSLLVPTSSTSSSSTTSTTSLFSPPTTPRASSSTDDEDEDNKRRIFGGIAAALAAAGTLATIFVARRPPVPPGEYGPY